MNFHDSDLDIVTRLRRWADIYAHVNVSDELLEAAGEIERLRRWQADANTLLNAWYDLAEEVYEAMGRPPAFLGRARVDLVRHALQHPHRSPDAVTGH